MPCSPPLDLPGCRYVRDLLKSKRPKAAEPPAPSSNGQRVASPPMDMAPIEEKREHVADEWSPMSLVCGSCWNDGLFAHGTFQEAWTSQKRVYSGFSYSTTWERLRVSSDGGCRWCRLILSTRPAGMHKENVHVAARFHVSPGTSGESPKGMQIVALAINDRPHSSYYLYARPDDPAAPFVVARPQLLELNTPSARAMALQSITECIRRHERCSLPHEAALPTRVVDCSDPSLPKLHVGNGERAPYVALSYVWGEAQPHRTTSDNVHTYVEGIDPILVPQTIRDAIETTHAFGVRYLWVDALCILHDSSEDKSQEIARMGSIFNNAYFTIIAASARRVTLGFLQSRSPPPTPDISLPFRCPDGTIGSMFLSPAWRQYDGSAEPVNHRAWCLEERMLSPRSLVYASHTLQYHCQSSTVNVGNAVCGPQVGRRLPDVLFRAIGSGFSSALSPHDRKALRWAWIETVGEYTQRELTKPSDKLVAIAAIAELFRRAWKSDYLAGLWRDSLLRDLLWYKSIETRFERPARYRAPTWSWAAVEGHVLASSTDDRLDPDSKEAESCEIVRCEVVALTPLLPLGKVAGGTLTLRAAMVKVNWNPGSITPDLYLLTDPRPAASEAWPLPPVPSNPESTHIGCAYPDSIENYGDEVWAVPVTWNDAMQYAAGLIVIHAPEEGQFRRVGYFHSPEGSVCGLSWMLGQERREITIV